MELFMEPHSWLRRWSSTIAQIPEPQCGNCNRIGLRWTISEVVLVYLLPGAELNRMLTLVVAMKSETPCEPELLDERSSTCGTIARILEKQQTDTEKYLGGNSDAVCLNE